jgi:chromosome partitioning protein
MNKIIAIAQHKGGVGKTTSVINIGAALARKGHKVLLVDLDAQANLTESLGVAAGTKGVLEALTADESVKPTNIKENIDLLPSSLDLAGTEVELLNSIGREYKLKEALQPISKKYNYILIDCPPSLGLLTVNALTVADEVYIPLQAEYLAVKGLKSLLDIITLIKKQLNKRLKIGGVFITQYDKRKVLNRDTSESLPELFKGHILKTKIRDNVALAEAPTACKDIFSYAPTSNGAEDYKALTDEIIKNNK